MKKLNFGTLTVLSWISLQTIGLAGGGASGVGGGGDLCEDRIKIVRDDVEQWIKQGGAKGLRLPGRISVEKYSKQMFEAIKAAKIKCVGEGDPGYPVLVNGTPKTCRFDKNVKTGTSKITCDFNKFQSIDESDQYVLVHHEYAGIASLESPLADDSNYFISNQITGYLADQIVKRLTVSRVVAIEKNKNGTIIDRELFAQLRRRYNGNLILGSDRASDKATGEILKDDSVLVEIKGATAGVIFTGITKGTEEFYYWPGSANGSSTNYYRRNGDSLQCRLMSNDLKNDPFQTYKCRFSVDAEGNVSPFGGRNISNSDAKISEFYSNPEEKDNLEFLRRSPIAITAQAGATMHFSMRNYYFQSQGKTDPSVEINLDGDLAKLIYDRLNSTATPVQYLGLVKEGKAIQCNQRSEPKGDEYHCRIWMNFHGAALPKSDKTF